MATYTDNYQLTKPTYAEQADIGVVNSNMNKIDEVMHSSQISLAPAYDSTKSYAEGDKVMYELLMYKCISPTTGVWDASKWERTTAAETGGGGSVDFDIFGEASGNPVSFADGSASALVECETEIVPTQDLHGYDKPWAGGAGKNKIPLTVNDIKTLNSGFTWNDNSFIYNGVTVTLNTDTDGNLTKISTNGTCLGNFDVKIAENLSISSGTYILSGSNGGNTSTYYLQGFGNVDYTSGSGILEIDGEKQFTLTATNNIRIRLYIRNTADMTGVEIYPMIRESGDSSGFEPYSNICPISGHSSVTINVSPTSDPSQGVDTTIQLGDTYYGGALDVTKGELTVTHRVITENDFVSVSSGTSGGGLHYANCDLSEPEATSANAISNMLVQNQNGWGSTIPCLATNTGSAPNIYPVRIYCSESTLADFKAAYSGLQICYELATPITVQLTPTEIATLLDQNYISSEDIEDIDLVYVKASAPIQPNPTGTPTATLTKLGIEGTVFEIPSGGGGGNVYGAFIDTSRVIQATKTVEQGSTDTYTATEDCFVIGGLIVAGGRASNMYVNGVVVSSLFLASGNTSAIQWIMLKRGDVFLFESGNNNSFYTVYGLRFGTDNIFTPQIYSTEERCVGVWTDNKPLYQKTFIVENITVSNIYGIDVSALDVDFGMGCKDSSFYFVSGLVRQDMNVMYESGSPNSLYIITPVSRNIQKGYFTMIYTKTTDTAGSGSYNTLGVPMVHYSTDEQVIGTWLGETLYQKLVTTGGSIPSGATLIDRIAKTGYDVIQYTKAS